MKLLALVAVSLLILSISASHASAPIPDIYSSDSLGNFKDVFLVSETVYVTVNPFVPIPAGQMVALYVVVSQEVWNDGDPLTDVSDGVETLSWTVSSEPQTFQIWVPLLEVGQYDIVVDVDNDGVFDLELDLIDTWSAFDPEVTAGFLVVPEVPLGTLIAFSSMFIALVGFVGFKRFRPKLRLQ